MIRTNDYKKGLFNGDCGIVTWNREDERAVFKDPGKGIKTYRSTDLPGYDPAFAITIHKSQGSEFKTVLIVIPDRLSPVLTRQLLYTGITRAREKVVFAGNLDIVKQAAGFSVNRMSGLTDGLDG